ncbi:hypothetical protein CDD81_7018 [Ophiocordyceps australis]|uniref:Rad4 beta-hairpin domain-containing protein n=1 Tax=Ophiocordyceps australis TaxID=1399860 RepID=A0A2C5YFZ7_9HYPO|nr:hypothetical protein CDD81_7018 [Ophiocordyceps australis]
MVRSRRPRNAADEGNIYQQMLVEAGVSTPERDLPARPLKRRRGGLHTPSTISSDPHVGKHDDTASSSGGDDDNESIEFEDVPLPRPTLQTLDRDSDDEADDEQDQDLHFEDVPLPRLSDATPDHHGAALLQLNLSAQQASATSVKRGGQRRKPLTKEERMQRVDLHKAHLVCLLAHVARRNYWCNDVEAQEDLVHLVDEKTASSLTPPRHLSQFTQTEKLKHGLRQTLNLWKSRYAMTEKGLGHVHLLKDYEPPSAMDSCFDRASFREAAKKLQGSRDLGAQLYCALLRAVGVRARLVCSLQPLALISGAQGQDERQDEAPASGSSRAAKAQEAVSRYQGLAEKVKSDSSSPTSGARAASRSAALSRLGNARAPATKPSAHTSSPTLRRQLDRPVKLHESAFPVYWVEVLDIGHQKWQPVDAVVLGSMWNTKVFEPPITDKANCLSYVVAFEADGRAKDVTRRYAKAYAAKTRKLRVESATDDGQTWWEGVMKLFKAKRPSDLDQIEDGELANAEAREPMPRNLQDFKKHPVYALERHLRRNEVLVEGAAVCGTVGASGSRGVLDKIYRRKDVRIARSADKWYRLGREVKANEIAAKWLPTKPRDGGVEGGGGGARPIYTIDQTDMFQAPPVLNGQVPKNKFGNIDLYVASMLPRGGAYIGGQDGSRAALLLGIDYAPALTGFQFQGRHGTAVLDGVVVAAEYKEAVEAVMAGLAQLREEASRESRMAQVLAKWRRLMVGLRIRERIWSGVDAAERQEAEGRQMDDDDDDDYGAGGWLAAE